MVACRNCVEAPLVRREGDCRRQAAEEFALRIANEQSAVLNQRRLRDASGYPWAGRAPPAGAAFAPRRGVPPLAGATALGVPMADTAQLNAADVSLSDYLDIIRRRHLIIIQTFAVVTTIGLITTMMTTPIYRATAKLKVEAAPLTI